MSMIKQDALYQLLPAIYRLRDAAEGEPLRALLEVIEREFNKVEANTRQLYDNWFIETCEEWVIPYIGDLLGVKHLHTFDTTVFSQRAWVANTLSYRRRKGTAPVLEQLARDITGWPARVVEYFQLLSTTQHFNHLRPGNFRTPDLRDTNALELLGTPFETAAHTVDVRRISHQRGRYNIPNIGLFLWRLQDYTLPRSTARLVGSATSGRYTFSPLGIDMPLFNCPRSETEITHIAEEINLPGQLRRRVLYDELEQRRRDLVEGASTETVIRRGQYFGRQPVLQVFADGQEIPPEKMLVCHLETWRRPPLEKIYHRSDGSLQSMPIAVAIDPQLGRLTFPNGQVPGKVQVTCSYGFSGDVGGGPYNRQDSIDQWYDPIERPATWQMGVTRDPAILNEAKDPTLLTDTLTGAVERWNAYVANHPGAFGMIAMMDNDSYDENLTGPRRIQIPEGSRLAIVAADWPQRDVPGLPGSKERRVGELVPFERRPHIDGRISVEGDAPATTLNPGEVIFDGLLIEGKLTVVAGKLGRLRVAHCTLVPEKGGLAVNTQNEQLAIILESSISGSIALAETVKKLRIASSTIDAADNPAVEAPGTDADFRNSTFFGAVRVQTLAADGCIFNEPLEVLRRQSGCVRFCFLPPESAAPRRYRCQPDLEIVTQIELAAEKARKEQRVLSIDERQEIRRKVIAAMVPGYTSRAYGHPGYAQLERKCPQQIRTGAEDSSEMGVFSSLLQPQREANLQAILEEYLPFGLEAGIFFVT